MSCQLQPSQRRHFGGARTCLLLGVMVGISAGGLGAQDQKIVGEPDSGVASERGSLSDSVGVSLDAPLETQPSGDAVSLDVSTATPETETREDETSGTWRWNTYWQEGLYFSLERDVQEWRWGFLIQKERTERFAGKIGVRFEVDAAAFAPSGNLDFIDSNVLLRRFRFYSSGEFPVFLPVHYKFEIGLVEDDFQLRNIYFWIKDIPWFGTLKFGHFKTPMSLAGYGSSRDSVGMESSAVVDAFKPGLKLGIQTGRAGQADRFSWATGLFVDGDDQERGDASESGGRAIGRMTGLPWFSDEEGEAVRLSHLGASINYTFSNLDTIRYRSRPESFVAPFLVDTGDLGNARSALISGLEFANVHGPVSLQAEYMFSNVESPDGIRARFDGGYLMGSWFLTGESRPYRRDIGVFDRLTPRREFSLLRGGLGAIELFGRFTYIDLIDGPVDGGRMSVLSSGINWYWSRTMKLRFNYNYADVDGGATPGSTHIFQTRLQLAF